MSNPVFVNSENDVVLVLQPSLGAPGPQGNQGAQGVQGHQGFQGQQGNVGAQGPQGSIGQPGPQGFQGVTGAQGNQGFQGDTGAQGDQGFQGATGAQGDQGSAGPQGPQGNQGNTGAQGFQGFQGDVGPQGSQGNQGTQGAQGAVGSQGVQGHQGVQGDQGPQGNSGSQGPQGFQGDVGEVKATVSETAPEAPENGQLWYNSALGILLSWYEDGDSGQWVETGGTPSDTGVQSVTGDGVDNTDPANPVLTFPTAGEIGAIPSSEKGAANGVATLGADGVVPSDESYPMGDIAPLFESHLFYAPMSSVVQDVGLATVYYHFIRINADVPIDRIYVRCTNTGGGDGEVRMGIYGPATPPLKNTGGLSLIVDTGMLPINATGLIGATIDVTLQRGWYMIAMSNKRATGTDWQSPQFVGGTSTTIYSSPSWVHLVAIPQALYGGVQSADTTPSQPLTNPSPTINMLADVPPVTFIPVVYFRRKVT